MFKELIEKVPAAQLDQKDVALINNCIAKLNRKGVSASSLRTLFANELRYAKVAKEGAGITSGDIDTFNKIALITTGKIFTSGVLDKIASIQPLDQPHGYIYYVEFEYGDDLPSEGISAGDKLRAKRSVNYGNVPEETNPRRIKTEVRRELVDTSVRKYDISWTFEAQLGLMSVFGDQAENFIDDKVVNTVANKAKDELELAAITAIDAAVPSAHTETFHIDSTDCLEAECQARQIYKLILGLSRRVLQASGVFPNYLIVGSEALVLLEGNEEFRIEYANDDPNPVGLARQYVGVLNRRFNLIYDPFLDNKIILGFKDINNEFASGLFYAPFIPFGVTAPILEKNLNTSRIVFAVDMFKVLFPESFAKIVIA